MYYNPKRHERALKGELSRNLSLFFFENREINELIEDISSLGREPGLKGLALCVAFSNISGNIVPKVVRHLKDAARVLEGDDLLSWITGAFSLLDSEGLESAKRYLEQTAPKSLESYLTPKGLKLKHIAAKLETFLRGVSGSDIPVASSPTGMPYTDTGTVFLPAQLSTFKEKHENMLFSKLLAVHLWGQTAFGTLSPVNRTISLDDLFGPFTQRHLAIGIYRVLEAARIERFIRGVLPGLVRDTRDLKQRLLSCRVRTAGENDVNEFVDRLVREFLGDEYGEALSAYASRPGPDQDILAFLYDRASALPGEYVPFNDLFPCDILPEAVTAFKAKKREELSRKLYGLVERIIDMPEREFDQFIRRAHEHGEQEPPDPSKKYLLVRGALMEPDVELLEALEQTGHIPGGTLVDGSDTGGGRQTPLDLRVLLEEEDEKKEAIRPVKEGIRYDEWDYKRSGYKKGWCTLNEHGVHPMDEPFVQQTLAKYGGYVASLRKKFELLRSPTRLLRRQKDGDDIDIDAAVEALVDMKEGLAPSEGLYTLLRRDERDIATLFLLDMSGSTKGWINVAEKESLVLMCEALEALGDRYAIYGFSGMTRNRCDYYHIKHFGESYSGEVKRRIAGVLPKDYTRMGPAIRHATSTLSLVDARTRLLIAISDGKPEDYDAYKGEYGIEDTRQALIEARNLGIHAFCITIDRKAHEYLPHMFGAASYTFIDDVRKLPSRITDVYTRLTT